MHVVLKLVRKSFEKFRFRLRPAVVDAFFDMN